MWHPPSAESVQAALSEVKLHSINVAVLKQMLQSTFAETWRAWGCLDRVQGLGLSHCPGLSSNSSVLQTFLQTGLAHYKQAETQVFEHLKGGPRATRQADETPPAILSVNLSWLSARLKGVLHLA